MLYAVLTKQDLALLGVTIFVTHKPRHESESELLNHYTYIACAFNIFQLNSYLLISHSYLPMELRIHRELYRFLLDFK